GRGGVGAPDAVLEFAHRADDARAQGAVASLQHVVGARHGRAVLVLDETLELAVLPAHQPAHVELDERVADEREPDLVAHALYGVHEQVAEVTRPGIARPLAVLQPEHAAEARAAADPQPALGVLAQAGDLAQGPHPRLALDLAELLSVEARDAA